MARPKGKKPEPTAVEREAAAKAKRASFVKAVNLRGNKAYKAIGLLRNLANLKKHTFTADDVRMLLDPLNKQLDAVAAAFESALKGGTVAPSENVIKIE